MSMDPVDVAELALSLSEIDPDKPSPARVYDYWLGGSQNFAADREIGQRTAEVMPHVPAAARANRAFLTRVVRHLVEECGINQLLDLGSGVPTAGNVHEVARRANPDARIVYVDIDPVAIAHSRALLADIPGTEAILADLRKPEAVLAHPLLHETLDLGRPVAVLMFAVLHFIADAERPWALLHDFVQPTVSGSYFAFSHGVPGGGDAQTQASAARAYADRTGVPYVSRAPERLGAWLADPALRLEAVSPGLVSIIDWKPEPDSEPAPDPLVYGVLARRR
jgi:SAM-dependent methyltransferase